MTNANDTASVAAAYVQRGWKVIQLHDVSAGACSCEKGQYCDSAGKHPVARAWQLNYLSTMPEVYAAWATRPQANVGVVTGSVSGIWVLDIDPKHGGLESLAGLEMVHGALPKTYMVRTGSGGLHFYFRLDDIDFDLTNTTGRVGGRFPPGMDVRGRGGFVVAPPSVSGRGGYGALPDPDLPHLVGPVTQAPIWLTEMQRPKAYVRPEILPEAIFREGHAYALTAVRGELNAMASAAPGTRNDTAYRVGCRVYELALASWSGLEVEQVEAAFLQACAQANTDGRFLDGEAWSVWLSVQRKVREPATLPPAEHLGTVVDWVPPPSDFDQAGQGSAGNGGVPGESINGSTDLLKPDDPFEIAVRYEMGRLMVRAEAARRLAEKDQKRTDFSLELVDETGLAEIPGAVVLVEDYLDMDSLARINGPSGHGKSFVVLDFGACVSAGISWHGYAVTQAEVWYVLGEGARGVVGRAQAWAARHELAATGIRFLPRALQVDGPEWPAFVEHARLRRPGLIVLDTQARMTVGVKENDATEMGVVVDALDELRRASGACVLLVHHRGLQGDHGRGSTAIKGALDHEIDVSKRGTEVTVKVTKRKDGLEPEPLLLHLTPYGPSAVLIGAHDTAPGGAIFVSPSQILSQRQKAAIAIAHALMDAPGLTKAEVRHNAKVTAGLTGTADAVRQTLYRGWSDLEDLGRIAKVQGREAYHFIDLDGAAILSANPDKVVQDGPEVYEAP